MPEKIDLKLPHLPWHQRLLSCQRQEFVGLDIGSQTIKLVRLRRGHPWKIVECAVATLSPRAIIAGRIEIAEEVIETIKGLIIATESQDLECAIAISGSSLITKRLTLQQMSPAQLQEALIWEAEMYLPWDVQDVDMDASILKIHNEKEKMDILLVAVQKKIINEYLSVVKEAGLKPVVVEPRIIVQMNLLRTLSPEIGLPTSSPILLIDIGAESTEIGIIHRGEIVYCRYISTGSNLLTTELQKHFGISAEEAEKWKRDIENLDSFNNPDFDHVAEAGKVVKQAGLQLIKEIQRSLDFFVAKENKENIGRVYLTGGGSNCYHLKAELQHQLMVEVTCLNPFKNIEYQPENIPQEYGHCWTTAISLALRGLDSATPGLMRLNLCEKKQKTSKRKRISQIIKLARENPRAVKQIIVPFILLVLLMVGLMSANFVGWLPPPGIQLPSAQQQGNCPCPCETEEQTQPSKRTKNPFNF